jgi:hypothetical protein
MSCFDSFESCNERWLSKPIYHQPNRNIPEGLNNDQFVNWGLQNIAGRHDLVNSYLALKMTRDLTWGARMPQMGGMYFNEASWIGSHHKLEQFSREDAANEMLKMCERRNFWEKRRAEHVSSLRKRGGQKS